MAGVPQEIVRGVCLIHNTQDLDKLMEPLVMGVTKNNVIYTLPGERCCHFMSIKEVVENYTIVDIMNEAQIEDYINNNLKVK